MTNVNPHSLCFICWDQKRLQKFLVDALAWLNDNVDQIDAADPADQDGGRQHEPVRGAVAHRNEHADDRGDVLKKNWMTLS